MGKIKRAVIVDAARTAVGRAIRGSLKDTRPERMGEVVIKALLERNKAVTPKMIDDLIVGCAMPEGEMGMNLGRMVVFAAGLPYQTTGMTVNRFCCSGLETIAMAAQRVMLGSNDIVIAGGIESMTMVPMGGNKPSGYPELAEVYPEAYSPMGLTAELVAQRYDISREAQDEFAFRSHSLAKKAIDDGKFDEEIIPVETFFWQEDGTKKEITFKDEEIPRPTTMESLAKLRPVFDPTGTVTAGNSSPLSDGAAFALIMSEDRAKELGLTPKLMFHEYQVAGVPPEVMGIGPKEAVPKLLKKVGKKIEDIDVIEINEAFASQSVYCARELGFGPEQYNVNGGAIALGHPLGCTGAKLTTMGMNELIRRNGQYLIVTMCIGGGMGAAGLFERYV